MDLTGWVGICPSETISIHVHTSFDTKAMVGSVKVLMAFYMRKGGESEEKA